MKEEVIEKLIELIGEDWVDTDPERVASYSKESTNESYGLVAPEPVEGSVIVKPADAQGISKIMKYANQEKIPVIVKGGGTALSANAISVEPGIILSVERLNKILEVDEDNLVIQCETAVTLGDLNEELKTSELYFPLHPGDEGAQVGGMVVMNAGGVRAVRHGIMRNQVRGMEVVLPTGEIVNYGGKSGKLVKDNAGYNLMQLLIGSEGTLGIITKATLRLYPEPQATGTLVISYEDRRDAFKTVPEILKKGITPVAIEYIGKEQIQAAAADIGKEWPAKEGNGYLMLILAEDKEDDLYEIGGAIDEISSGHHALSMLIAETRREQQDILDIRSHILPSIQKDIVDSPDVTVPPSEIGDFLDVIDELSAKYNTELPVVAHAGDGNMHVIILKEDGAVPAYYDELKETLYKNAVEAGGTITGEHGVGMLRLKYLPIQFSDRELNIMWQIKKAFDPNNILNPGKEVIDMSN